MTEGIAAAEHRPLRTAEHAGRPNNTLAVQFIKHSQSESHINHRLNSALIGLTNANNTHVIHKFASCGPRLRRDGVAWSEEEEEEVEAYKQFNWRQVGGGRWVRVE